MNKGKNSTSGEYYRFSKHIEKCNADGARTLLERRNDAAEAGNCQVCMWILERRFSTTKIYDGYKSIGPRVSTEFDQCMYIAACPTCKGYNWEVYGNPDLRTNYHCEFIKLQMIATVKLQYLLNKSLLKNLLSVELPDDVPKSTLKTLKAANLILKNLDEHHIIEGCKVG